MSRDTFDYIDKEAVTLTRYVARQSLVSAFAPQGTATAGVEGVRSNFQRRMLDWDERSALPELLRECATSIDLLMWDIVDERLGYFQFPDGSVITNTVERIKLTRQPFLAEGGRHVPFGSPEHLEAFTNALELFAAELTALDLIDKLALIAPPWAAFDQLGEPTPPSFGLTAENANRLCRRYLDVISDRLGVHGLGAEERAVADAFHKWGAAPFHYSQELYANLVQALTGHTAIAPSHHAKNGA